MKIRSETELVTASKTIQQNLVKRGFKLQQHNLDNEAPKSMKTFMTEVDENFQLTPQHIHQVKASKRAIQAWKNHFMAGMCSIYPYLQLHIWCRLMKQADIKLNMLHAAHMKTKYQHMSY